MDIDFTKIKYSDDNPKFIQLSYDNEEIKLGCQSVFIPFGLEKNFNNYILKILLNKESEILFQSIRKIEENNISYLRKFEHFSDSDYKSQIIKKDNYGEFLIVKIPLIKNQFIVDICDKNKNTSDVYQIQKKQKINIYLQLNSIWRFKNRYSCIPKVSKIELL